MYNNFRCNIKSIREYKQISQDDLAQIVGVRRETIHRIECMKQNPSYFVCVKIADALGCSLDDLYSLCVR